MEDLFSHPAVQSALVPLVVALVIFLVTYRFKPDISGFAAILSFLAAVYLIKGMSLLPLTSTNKIILIAIVSAAIGMVIDLMWNKLSNYTTRIGLSLSLVAIAATLWVIWPVLTRDSTAHPWIMGLGLSIYAGWMVFSFAEMQEKKEKISAAILALGIGTGIVSIIGATTLYGQLAIPFAAVAGAWMLLYLFNMANGRFSISFIFTASMICSILGAAATVYADLSWLTLVFLGLIPVVMYIPMKQNGLVFVKLAITTFMAFIPVIAAIWYTSQQTVDSGYYG